MVEYSSILGEHSGILCALIHGQEEIKSTLEGFKIEVNEKFGEITVKQESFDAKQYVYQGKQDDIEARYELLARRTWNNESDIYRLKKIAGIS